MERQPDGPTDHHLEKLIQAQEAPSTSSIDRAIDDMLALVQAMLPGHGGRCVTAPPPPLAIARTWRT